MNICAGFRHANENTLRQAPDVILIGEIRDTEDGKGRRAAVEVLLNTPIIADKLLKGDFHEIKAIMGKSQELGMRTFDASLLLLLFVALMIAIPVWVVMAISRTL